MRVIPMALVGMLLCAGCITARGELPAPPSDQDLTTDGSAEASSRLEKRFAVFVGADRLGVGGAVRRRYFFPPLLSSLDPEMRAYVASDPLAAAAMPERWVDVVRTGTWVLAVVGLGSMITPLLLGAAVVTVAEAGPRMGQTVFTQQQVIDLTSAATVATLVGALATAGFVGVAVVLDVIVRRMEDRAFNLFNDNLRQRIRARAQASPPAPAVNDASEAPPAPAPPAGG